MDEKIKEPEGIKCQLCGVEFQKITNTHLKRVHPDWTTERYCEEFGEGSLMSDDWRWIIAQSSVAKASITRRDKQLDAISEFTPEEYQVIIGGLLGDSWLFDVKNRMGSFGGRGSTYLCMQHKFTQLPYMAWKARLLSRFGTTLYQRFLYNTVKGRFDVEHRVNTTSHVLFGDMAKKFYPAPDFKKVLPLDLIGQLDPLGLAVWYQDDGNLSNQVYIYTYSFDIESVKQAAQILTDKFDITFRVNETNLNSKRVAYITIYAADLPKFFELITPFIHPCLLYKVRKSASVTAEVTKRMNLIYGHYLLDYDGPCGASHGHNATVEISVKGPINPDTGMVVDFGDIKKIAQTVLDKWDHKVLNEVDPILAARPTAEVTVTYLAAVLRKYIPGLSCVSFYETDSSCASLRIEENDEEYLEDFLQRLAEAGEWWHELKSNSIKSSLFTNFWEG